MPGESSSSALVKADDAITKKSDYSRWLVNQRNLASAESVRKAQESGDERIKAQKAQQSALGLTRQQAAANQMKKVTEAREAHQAQNLSRGREVNQQVTEWKQGAQATKEQWKSYGQGLKESIKAEDRSTASTAALSALKREQAERTRQEDAAKAKELEELKALLGRSAQSQAAKVRAETSDQVIDEAKRVFYDQRVKAATDIKRSSQTNAKVRADAAAKNVELQANRRKRAKSAAVAAGKAKAALLTQRQQDSAAMREKKRALAETHRQRQAEEQTLKSASVKSVIRNSYMQAEAAEVAAVLEATGGGKGGSRSPLST